MRNRWRQTILSAAIILPLLLFPAYVHAAIDKIVNDSAVTSDTTRPAQSTFEANFADTAAIYKPALLTGDTLVLTPNKYAPDADTLAMIPYLTGNYTPPPKRSPTNTMLKSVAFPGWGQYSNKKYVKAGVIFAVESYFIYKAVDYGIKAGDSRKLWKSLPDTEAAAKAEAFRLYASDRDNRNSNIWYTIITAFLSMIDAYVDAHLQDFPKPVEPPSDVSLQLSPGNETRLSLFYQF